jgi:lysophospholipase L1-like esterase
LVIQILLSHEPSAWKHIDDKLLNNSTLKYYKQSIAVSNSIGCPIVDTWTLFLKDTRDPSSTEKKGSSFGVKIADSQSLFDFPAENLLRMPDENLFVDGVHLSALGNDLLFGAVMGKIKQEYPNLDPSVMPLVWST